MARDDDEKDIDEGAESAGDTGHGPVEDIQCVQAVELFVEGGLRWRSRMQLFRAEYIRDGGSAVNGCSASIGEDFVPRTNSWSPCHSVARCRFLGPARKGDAELAQQSFRARDCRVSRLRLGGLGGLELVSLVALIFEHSKGVVLRAHRVLSRPTDPLCAAHTPRGDHAERFLEGAACHGCLYVAEPSCERFNRYLDRALVVPTLGNPSGLAFSPERP